MADAIKLMKYEDESARAEHLGGYLAEVIGTLGGADALIPVPLHPRKLRERGYNQSQLLAERAGKALGIPVQPLIMLHRVTSSQVGLKGTERLAKVMNAFSIDSGYVPRVDGRYVLIDDVRTTGSTLNACVSALAGAGITRIDIATVALDMYPSELANFNALVSSRLVSP
ncbi:MAG: ComF family protein [Thermomicrobiales bacterium]